jgi:prepilin-type N-terminal cleavage/methylation domain-containing protein
MTSSDNPHSQATKAPPAMLRIPASRLISRSRPRRGFSIVEMLIALTVSGTLLAAMLVALDVMFKRYKVIADAAGTHVVARVVMHRMLAMIRTGQEFGPYPTDVLDRSINPADYDRIQFVSFSDPDNDIREVTTLETRDPQRITVDSISSDQRGPRVLWLVIERAEGSSVTRQERPLLDGVVNVTFNMEYDIGPRLRRATIDMTILPQANTVEEFDGQRNMWTSTQTDANTGATTERQLLALDAVTPTIRMVASTAPRGEQ